MASVLGITIYRNSMSMAKSVRGCSLHRRGCIYLFRVQISIRQRSYAL